MPLSQFNAEFYSRELVKIFGEIIPNDVFASNAIMFQILYRFQNFPKAICPHLLNYVRLYAVKHNVITRSKSFPDSNILLKFDNRS